MEPKETLSIQLDAVKALAEWKAYFADQVASQARELAKQSSSPGLVTLEHYRQAAKSAALLLLSHIDEQPHPTSPARL